MIRWVVEKYQSIYMFALLLIILGVMAYNSMPRESAPEIRRPMIFVTTIYPGVSAKDIESLITDEIEAELDGVEGLEKLASNSSEGVSSITAEFSGDTDVEVALRKVREQVDLAKSRLPKEAEDPMVKELNFSNMPILTITIAHAAGIEILESASDFLEEGIERVSGVLDVVVSGKLKREVAIEVNPIRLSHFGFSIDDVIKSIRDENVSIPGGTMKTGMASYSLAVSGEIKDPEIFKQIVVKKDGKWARLDTLANVSFHFAEPQSIARSNGQAAITLSVKKRSGVNLLRLVEDVRQFVNANQAVLPIGTQVLYSRDESIAIRDMVYDLENNILTSLALVLVITLFFLGTINAIFVSLAIPFSMLMSFWILDTMGITLNMVVLFSLVLALGMLVDNGIVIVENVYRHANLGKDIKEAAISGTKEVALPIFASTLTTILAFFPIIFMPDIMGEFLSYIPKTVIVVLSSSLVVGLTLTTMFCSRFLRVDRNEVDKMTNGSGTFVRFQALYSRQLRLAMAHPYLVVGGTFLFVIIGIIAYGKFGKEPIFFPRLDPSAVTISAEAKQGTTISQMDKRMRELESIVIKVPASLKSLKTIVGKAGGGNVLAQSSQDTRKGNIRLGFKRFSERKISSTETLTKLRESLGDTVGMDLKISQEEKGPPTGHPVSYRVLGSEYGVIGDIAQQIKVIIDGQKEAFKDIDHDFESSRPEVSVVVDREKAAAFGLNTRIIASTIRNTMTGSKISKMNLGKKEYDVVVRYEKTHRDKLGFLRSLEIVNKGARVPLSSVAEITHTSTMGVIKRRDRHRAVEIWADFKDGFQGKGQVKAEIDKQIKAISLPKGYRVTTGEGEGMRQKATQFLKKAFGIALLLILVVLVIQFNSFTQPAIIIASVFLSFGGVFWGLLVTGKTFVIIMSGIGIISLAGIVVNNAIVLIDFINVLVRRGMDREAAIIEAARTRLRPVLLTAITTVIGLLPMAFAISFDFHSLGMQVGGESAQMWRAMAWSVIFGLSVATVLTLMVIPCMVKIDFRWFSREPEVIPDPESLAENGMGKDQNPGDERVKIVAKGGVSPVGDPVSNESKPSKINWIEAG